MNWKKLGSLESNHESELYEHNNMFFYLLKAMTNYVRTRDDWPHLKGRNSEFEEICSNNTENMSYIRCLEI